MLPQHIEDNEILVRHIFNPLHISKDEGGLNINIYKTRVREKGISVNRLHYTTETSLKKLLKIPNQKFVGFASVVTEYVRGCGFTVEADTNPQKTHTLIITGYIVSKDGEAMPSAVQIALQELVERTRWHQDPNPEHPEWTGEQIS